MSKPAQEHPISVPPDLIKELLTESEWRMVKQRLLIINLLEDGLTIRQIAEQAKVGTDTVVRVSKMMQKPSLKKALSYLEGPSKNRTSWVFGKSED